MSLSEHSSKSKSGSGAKGRGRASCFLADVTEDYFRVIATPDCHPERPLIYVTEGNVVNVNVTALNASSPTSGKGRGP